MASTESRLFDVAQYTALGAWAALAVAPRTTVARAVTAATLVGCSGVYAFLIARGMTTEPMPEASLATLGGVRELLQGSGPATHAACWVHYLAFDLGMGLFEAELAGRLELPQAALWLSLPLTLMLGPIGLLTFCALAAGHAAWQGRLEDTVSGLLSSGRKRD
ncbi:hypothetical protein FNF27_01330 [Cafeteria roenbergensis]|uniref:DUF4281 domain-containing protein n=1 Tax=Cafeteria roenbergensis TaxID=33653 RepID=A0A5A8C5D1_CAFRO|nr:hypothetical protein FNF29_07104 [Cafeteria roenbergensis]KAA0164017.1 hypothetical protein FNF31_02566 [Cafeteria roenbergensis]KAA0172255.1 hypothetical protein FNF28_00258 [Cafeteria roenbergensis]KAA0177000.1 hypothetical protein FNF27_01330 [Cafeteria roenbergensis]|eukprot:KAA0147759.1 hypothetical protein FNF29_07104 [Cafeteria roenbergensis]